MLDLVTEGISPLPTRFAKRRGELADKLAHVNTNIVTIERQLANSEHRITPELIERFA